ncbi:uncharacterized protein LOC131026151 [Salvia miltiorrhiza]|uniref:uncharacterized protein LOC131026151 n=1 Tax=Salvia miltiorrhiza TaxID=226208 RepID=UPI0025AC3B7D|nr:uncharacterized protein LOC131026151 [Salvia miltiorrhiza]
MEELQRLIVEYVPPDLHNVEEQQSEYEVSDGDVHSDETDEDRDLGKSSISRVVYDPKCDHKELQIVIGMMFQDGWQRRSALTSYSIENGKFIQFRRVSKRQCEARCIPPCEWKVYASVVKEDQSFCIKRYRGYHSCPRAMSNKLLTSKWVAMKYLNVFRVRPELSIAELRADIVTRFKYDLPKDRLYKAKFIAKELVRGTVEHYYGQLRRYIAELRRVDREGRFELLLGDNVVFRGLYMGFSSLIKGFKRSCRPLIGLDGCFLKTYLGGILLCAIGKDGNDQMYPIAWAVVEIENEENWSWFLKCLIEDMGIGDGNGYAFISDQQKGLQNAVASLAPFAEHRNCARHVYMNWKKEHKGSTLKNMFWRAVRSTYIEEYKAAIEEMKLEDRAAYEDFINRDTHKFCKAFISTTCCSDMVDNNIAETFNGYILNARGKHIIHMCEEIRCNQMVRQVKKMDIISKNNDTICPNIRKKIEKLRASCGGCVVHPALGGKFEVHQYDDKFVVHIGNHTCTCRVWDVSGIPCLHAVAVIHFMNQDPVHYVHRYYTVENYMLGYQLGLEPVRGEKMWPEVSGFKVKPPVIIKRVGRPKKKRARSATERDQQNPNKLRKTWVKMTCKNYGGVGHNTRGCKNEKVDIPTKEKGKRGRPAKPKDATSTSTSKGRSNRKTPQATDAATVARERNFARRGVGVFIAEGTGNIYTHAPFQRRVHHVNRVRGNREEATSTTHQGVSSTQESRNTSENAPRD